MKVSTLGSWIAKNIFSQGKEDFMKRLCVFCGSCTGTPLVYTEAARTLGRLIAERGWGLVFGGGHVGLMGNVADAVLAGGGEVDGVIPQGLVDRELAHRRCTRLHITASMHERKARMAELANAFVSLPGGFGTLDETFEIVTWAQLGLHAKPIGLLNTSGYFDRLLSFLDHAVMEGFINNPHGSLLLCESSPAALLDVISRH
jgi:uncharacterized protein (TIGR00730 family)